MSGRATLVHLFPFIGLGLVIVCAGVIALWGGLVYPDAVVPVPTAKIFSGSVSLSVLAAEAQARVTWELAMLFLLLAIAAALVGSAIVIATCLRCGDTATRLSFYLAVAVAGVCVVLACVGFDISSCSLAGPFADLVEVLQPHAVKTILCVTDLLGGLTIFLLAVGVSACLVPVPADTVAAQRTLLLQTRRLRWLLYLSAAVLAGATLEVSTLYAWPASLAAEPGNREAILRIAGIYAVGAGTILTLLLLAGYGPAAIVLRHRVLRFAERATKTTDPQVIDDWLKQQGMESTHAQLLMRALAAISPLIAGGPLTSFLNQISF